MMVYIATRTENGHTAVFAPFVGTPEGLEKAKAMIAAHVKKRVSEGAFEVACTTFTPPAVPAGRTVRVGGSEGNPVTAPAPECYACMVAETILLASRELRAPETVYRVTQHPVIE